jgi:enterochelin esterase-like enzyme
MKSILACAFAALLSTTLLAQDAKPAGPGTSAPTGERIINKTFTLRAPQAKEVKLVGQWQKDAIPLTKDDKGDWTVTLEKAPFGVWEYSFSVDGMNVLDPKNTHFKPQREPGKSILHIPSTPPAPWDWQEVPHGTIHSNSYPSKVVNQPREVMVYTPPGYETSPDKKYPLFVLQHGSGDNQRTWVAHGKAHWIFDNLIAAGKMKPMVVMMIDGHPLGQLPREAGDAKRVSAMEAFEKELLGEALPLVESLYRVEKDPAQRAFAGLSMGGGQSLTVGLGHPEIFGWIGAFSAAPASAEAVQKFTADPAKANAGLKLLWIAVGKDDFLRKRNEDYIAILKEKGIHHEFHLTDGDHSWPVWRRYLADFAPLLFQAK